MTAQPVEPYPPEAGTRWTANQVGETLGWAHPHRSVPNAVKRRGMPARGPDGKFDAVAVWEWAVTRPGQGWRAGRRAGDPEQVATELAGAAVRKPATPAQERRRIGAWALQQYQVHAQAQQSCAPGGPEWHEHAGAMGAFQRMGEVCKVTIP